MTRVWKGLPSHGRGLSQPGPAPTWPAPLSLLTHRESRKASRARLALKEEERGEQEPGMGGPP